MDAPPRLTSQSALSFALMALALIYAFLAGLRTVADFDNGWQLATGRWVLQHHAIFSTDVFSFTAQGKPWIYPAFPGVVFYLFFLVGGYAALSWLNALACLIATAAGLRRDRPLAALLAILAVPSIAFRTVPRADLFTTVLFALLLRLLWHYRETGRGPLWLVPVITLCWVNLHLGFISGIGLCIAYAGAEIGDMLFPERRTHAVQRLKKALPYLVGGCLATLVNPWGWKMFAALKPLNADMQAYNYLVTEWSKIRLTPAVLAQAFEWRDPNAQFWWLALATVGFIALAAWKRRIGEAVFLAAALYVALHHLRLQAVAALIIVIVGGSVLTPVREELADSRKYLRWLSVGAVAAVSLVAVRGHDLITGRSYLSNGELSLFGAGRSWWYPERAAQFIETNQLPRNLMGPYNFGGYLVGRLSPTYPDYIDGRAFPFGPDLMRRANELVASPMDSHSWQEEADRWQINTVIFSTSRYAGLGFPLQPDCANEQWKPVYLDTSAIVFLRNTAQNAALVQRFALDCSTVVLKLPAAAEGNSDRARAERYNFDANAGAIYYLLQRDAEALAAYQEALSIFDKDPNLHLSIGQLYQAQGNVNDAEKEYRRSIELRPTELGWYALARLLGSQNRYAEAAVAVEQSAELALNPAPRYRTLAQVQLKINHPKEALSALKKARETASSEELTPDFRAQLDQLESQAQSSIH